MKTFKTKFFLNAGWGLLKPIALQIMIICLAQTAGAQLGPQYQIMSVGGGEMLQATSGNKHFAASFNQLTEYDLVTGETRWYDASNAPWTTYKIVSIKAGAQGRLWVYLADGSLWLKDGASWSNQLNYISTDQIGHPRLPTFFASNGDSLYFASYRTDTLFRFDNGQLTVVRTDNFQGQYIFNSFVETAHGDIGILGPTGEFNLYDVQGDSLIYMANLAAFPGLAIQESASDENGDIYLWGQSQGGGYNLLGISMGQLVDYTAQIQPLLVGVQPNSLNFEIFSGFDDSLRVKIENAVFALNGNQFQQDTFYTNILTSQSRMLHAYNSSSLYVPRRFSNASGTNLQTYFSYEGDISGWNAQSRINFIDPNFFRFSYLPRKTKMKGVGIISNVEVDQNGMVLISGFAGCIAGQGDHWQNVIPESVYPDDVLIEDTAIWVFGKIYDNNFILYQDYILRYSPSGVDFWPASFANNGKLVKDRYGRVWTWGETPIYISYYSVAQGMVNNAIGGWSYTEGVAVDAQGDIYMSLDGQVYKIDAQLNLINMQVPPPYANQISGIKADKLGRILVFTYNNATIILTQQGWVLEPNLVVPPDVFYCGTCSEEVDEEIHFDSQNHVWWVGQDGLLNEYDWNQVYQTDILQYIQQPITGASNTFVLACIDSVGNKWLFNESDMILLYNENGVQDANNLTTASGNVFHDRNANAQLDPQTDGDIPFAMVNLSPGFQSFTNQNGRYAAVLPFNDYTITGPQYPSFQLTTDSAVYHLPLNDPNGRDHIDFGYASNGVNDSFEVTVTPTPFSCGNTAYLWLNVRNLGSTVRNGDLLLHLDTLCSFDDLGGGQLLQPGTIRWNFTNFEPFTQLHYLVRANIPIVDTNQILPGDSLSLSASLHYTDDNNQSQLGDDVTANQLFTCAYDPNDKTALPQGPSTGDSTLMDTPIDYVIRFQNTGNDTAFHVQIRDTLDLRLDWSSFEIISASHLMGANIYSDRFVSFDFPNINLVDSFTNEPASHGYLRYRIRPRAGLVEGSSVRNTAHIYFDQNPPIVTNTTQTIFVEELDGAIVSTGFVRPNNCLCEAWPNPFSTSTHLRFFNPGREKVQISVFNTLGQQVFSTTSYGADYDLKRQDLAAGLYRVVVNGGSCVGSCNVVVY